MKQDLNQTRYFMYVFISIWKMLCFFCATCVIIWIQESSVSHFFTEFSNGFGAHAITIEEIKPVLGGTSLPDISELIPTGDDITVQAHDMTPVYVLLINVFTTYLVYISGKFACKIMIQGFSYAFPVNLTIPVSISLLITLCGLRNGDPCFFHDTFPGYLFFQSPPVYFLNDFISIQHAWIWLFWLLSQTWISLHIWTPKCERLASTEKLFVSPLYNSFLIDQSMALNRRRDDQADVKTEDLNEMQNERNETTSNVTGASDPRNNIKSSDSITRIYVCATMWHETKEEMIEFLKSIMRMDEDQCARRLAQKHLEVVDRDYYELETHIFFDDAFAIPNPSKDDKQVNRFVKLLVNTMDEAATEVHQTQIHIRAPVKYPTAYGGRLVWTLPGKTKMIAHLKDKSKIRPKKRWSQVMYMYYLLGHRLMELPIPVDRKDVIAENTFLLALDGDIDFHPHAVQLLVDLMKKNKNLGAACGRIHPVGSGPMVWYQMFEYAIGHWLQKATEHMIGCVLCSPGCFSLFRAAALMDDNVMKKYTTTVEEARHSVQYDQGEDRWLCTLILQQGYQVEYSAASDAYTHCPEGFNEFYNQRRRWIPSTIANILDLLQDAKRTIKINDSISGPYIAYQILLMAGTILGPGTIFLMLVGAFVAAFQIDNWTSFYYNLIPILLFMLVCFTCKSNIQLFVAQILSTAYALIMMAVIVGTALQLREDGIRSPSAIFLIAMTGSFFIAACLHLEEFYCIILGIYVHITKEYLQLEPIGLVFVFFFALILVIQFTAMLFHRFGTISHILASTDLNFYCTKKAEDLSPNALLNKNGVDIVKEMQQLRDVDDPGYNKNSNSGPDRSGRRKTIHKLENAAKHKREAGTLEEAFNRRFFKMDTNGQSPGTPLRTKRITMRRETIKAFENRRDTVIEERRKSRMQTLGANNDYDKLPAGGVQLRSHRNSTTMSVQDDFPRGQMNVAFVDDEDANSIQMRAMNNWNNNNTRM
ncbi:krotzkopf verkehrt [Carabus blaptoides fortunei]